MSQARQDGVFPQQQLATDNTDFNVLSFVIQQLLGRVNVATLVRVEAVHTTGRVGPVGFVDVTPLVNQLDGAGQAVSHTTVYGLPYLRSQGGANAVIVDPKVGDIGICVFADRDISSAKAAGAQATPGSLRRFDFADGVYLPGWNHATAPERYIVVDDDGIKIEAGPLLDENADDIQITARVSCTVTAPEVTVNATATATVTSPLTTVNGPVVINGSLSII
jgi:hypothetical protein